MSQQVFSNESKKYPLSFTDGSLSNVAAITASPSIPCHDANNVVPNTNSLVGKESEWGNRIICNFALVQDSTGLNSAGFTPGANAVMKFVLAAAADYPVLDQVRMPLQPIAYTDDAGAKTGSAKIVYSGTDVVMEIYSTTTASSAWSTARSAVVIPAFTYSWIRDAYTNL